jgi:hypothetical protein
VDSCNNDTEKENEMMKFLVDHYGPEPKDGSKDQWSYHRLDTGIIVLFKSQVEKLTLTTTCVLWISSNGRYMMMSPGTEKPTHRSTFYVKRMYEKHFRGNDEYVNFISSTLRQNQTVAISLDAVHVLLAGGSRTLSEDNPDSKMHISFDEHLNVQDLDLEIREQINSETKNLHELRDTFVRDFDHALYHAHHKIPPSPRHPRVVSRIGKENNKKKSDSKVLKKLSSGLKIGVRRFAKSASKVMSLNRIIKMKMKKKKDMSFEKSKQKSKKKKSSEEEKIIIKEITKKSKSMKFLEMFSSATSTPDVDIVSTSDVDMMTITPSVMTPIRTPPVPPLDPPPPGPVPYSPPRGPRRTNSMKSIPPPITDGMIQVFGDSGKRKSIVASKRMSIASSRNSIVSLGSNKNENRRRSHLSRKRTETAESIDMISSSSLSLELESRNETKKEKKIPQKQIMPRHQQEDTKNSDEYIVETQHKNIVLPHWAASSNDAIMTNTWHEAVPVLRSEWLLLSLLAGSLTESSSFEKDKSLRGVLMAIFDSEMWRSRVRRLVRDTLTRPYMSDKHLRSDAKSLLGVFVQSAQNVPYVVRFACKLIMSLKHRERSNALGVYPCEKLIHKLLFQRRLCQTILSEILPIEDVHKKFVSDFIIASTDPKMKNPEVLEFLRVLVGVGHPSPREELIVDDEDMCEDDSVPPGLSIGVSSVDGSTKIVSNSKEEEKEVSIPTKNLEDLEKAQSEIRDMIRTIRRDDEDDVTTRVRQLKSELFEAREDIRKRDAINRDGWSRVFARSLSDELQKDFMGSRKNRVTWSSTSRQRLFGGDVSMLNEDEDEDDDMPEGVTSMLSSFRSVSPAKKRFLSSPQRRSRRIVVTSPSPSRLSPSSKNRDTGDMDRIYSILDRLRELSEERRIIGGGGV